MLKRLRYLIRIYFRLQVLHFRTHLEYEADFWIGIVGAILYQGAGVVFLWVIFQRIPQIAGWTLWQVALLYGMTIIARGLAEVLGDGQWTLRQTINQGEFDKVLVRLVPPFLQVITEISSIHGFGSVILGGVIIAQASSALQLGWGVGDYLFLFAALLNGTVMVSAVNLATNSIYFWDSGSNVFPVMLHNCLEFVKFPISLYGRAVQVFITWVLPFAFVSYFPGLLLLGQAGDYAWLSYATLLSGPAVVGITSIVWRQALAHYQGTGS